MRIRTAAGLTCAFIAVKVGLTMLTLDAWSLTPERRFANRWHIELGTVGEWIAAVAAAGAAVVALRIAASDRRARNQEREGAALAQARLVREELDRHIHAQDFVLRIHNHGSYAILDVYLEDVQWALEPDAHWKDNHDLLQIVKPDNEALAGGALRVSFIDHEGIPFPRKLGNDRHGNPQFAETTGRPEAVYTFMDANGIRWRTGTLIETPERLAQH